MSIFSPNSKLYNAISLVGNLLLLNLCWLLFSLPLVTVGAATVSCYAVAFKIIDGTEGYVFKDFFKYFKANFKQGTVLWLITAIVIYGFYLDVQILTKGDPGIPAIVVSLVAFVAIFFSLLYTYPLCARYENKVFFHIKNSFLISTRYLGRTLFLLVVIICEVGILFWNTKTLIFAVIVGPIAIIFSIAGTAKRIFLEVDKKNASAPKSSENNSQNDA